MKAQVICIPTEDVKGGSGLGGMSVLSSGMPHMERAESSAASGFAFAGLTPGEWSLVAEMEGFVKSETLVLQLKVGQVLEGVELRFAAPGRIQGSVHPEWLRENLVVELEEQNDEDGRYSGSSMRADVSADGKFEFKVVGPGEYEAHLLQEESQGTGLGIRYSSGRMNLGPREKIQIYAGQVSTLRFGAPGPDSVVLTGTVREGSNKAKGWRLSFNGSGVDQVEARTDDLGKYKAILPKSGHLCGQPE